MLLLVLLLLLLAPGCPKKAQLTPVVPAQPREPEKPQIRSSEAKAEPKPQAQRLPTDPETIDSRKRIQETLVRVEELVGLLADRAVNEAQREERDAGIAFLAQAREALNSGDVDRAVVLAEKARVLIENVERTTRP